MPNVEFLRSVASGGIKVRIEHDATKGYVWHCDGGLLNLRLHEEAGFIEPMLTAMWAGYPTALYAGVSPKLTDKGVAAIG